jgi:hypothetical protein
MNTVLELFPPFSFYIWRPEFYKNENFHDHKRNELLDPKEEIYKKWGKLKVSVRVWNITAFQNDILIFEKTNKRERLAFLSVNVPILYTV